MRISTVYATPTATGLDVANKTYYATVMGLLLWPLYANDHVREQRSNNQGLKGFIEKIKHTIEEYMF